MKKSKYVKLDNEAIARDYASFYKKHESTHMITPVLGTSPDLRELKPNESVCWGDGKTFHFKLTKV